MHTKARAKRARGGGLLLEHLLARWKGNRALLDSAE
jgi:hypothetical protein